MLEVEWLMPRDKPHSFKHHVVYTPDSSLLSLDVERTIKERAKQEAYNVVQAQPDTLTQELHGVSLFGEKLLWVDLSTWGTEHVKMVANTMAAIAGKQDLARTYFKIPALWQKELEENHAEAYKGFIKQCTHIQQTKATKSNVKKVLDYFPHWAREISTIENLDQLQKAVENMVGQGKEFQEQDGLELLFKKLDIIWALCIQDNQFDLLSFTKYVKPEEAQQNFFRLHEVLAGLTQSRKESKDYAIQQVLVELDHQQHKEEQEPRQLMAKCFSAIIDLLLVSNTLGQVPDESPHMSRFKKQRLQQFANLEPVHLVKLQTLLAMAESKLRNNPSFVLAFKMEVAERFFA